mmetsp:Transcript_11290/g.25932  ORF Transcript_11290/g.25932 Transcript_11290/m.25932 type:complete len:142 (-) Transcript_11290:98-523(-)
MGCGKSQPAPSSAVGRWCSLSPGEEQNEFVRAAERYLDNKYYAYKHRALLPKMSDGAYMHVSEDGWVQYIFCEARWATVYSGPITDFGEQHSSSLPGGSTSRSRWTGCCPLMGGCGSLDVDIGTDANTVVVNDSITLARMS